MHLLFVNTMMLTFSILEYKKMALYRPMCFTCDIAESFCTNIEQGAVKWHFFYNQNMCPK